MAADFEVWIPGLGQLDVGISAVKGNAVVEVLAAEDGLGAAVLSHDAQRDLRTVLEAIGNPNSISAKRVGDGELFVAKVVTDG